MDRLQISANFFAFMQMVRHQGYGRNFYYDSGEFIPRLKRKLSDDIRETWPGYSDEALGQARELIKKTLTGRECAVMSLRFGLDDGCCKSRSEVMEYYGKSESAIRYYERRAATKLQHNLEQLTEILKPSASA